MAALVPEEYVLNKMSVRAALALVALVAMAIPFLGCPAIGQVNPGTTEIRPFGVPQGTKIIYILATGTDVSGVKGKLMATFVRKLDENYDVDAHTWFMPSPDLTLQQFSDLCEQPKGMGVEGAVVLNLIATGSGTHSHFVYRNSWTDIDVTASYLTCNKVSREGVAYSAWRTRLIERSGSVVTVTALPAIGLLLELASVYMIFVPSKTRETDSTLALPTPNPLPPHGSTSSVVTKVSSTSNVGGSLAPIAGAVLAQSVQYTQSVTQIVTVDEQGWRAVDNVVDQIIMELGCAVVKIPKGHKQVDIRASVCPIDFCSALHLRPDGPLSTQGLLEESSHAPINSIQ